jgi:formylglycine-generating enzyme required for sulfatase activity
MVLIPGVAGGDPYCIDSTEVTIAQYFQWLNTAPALAGQDSVCKPWNTTFEPDLTGSCQGAPVDPAVAPNYPMVCVDWCDAFAYCKGTGKRLCGKIGGGPSSFGAPADASMSQWYRACSAGASKSYPYGDQYNDAACVGDGYDGQPGVQVGSDQVQEVGTAPGCEGGYLGVYDLSGNVREWEDSCESTNGQADKCYRRGGSFKENASALSCASQLASVRASTTIDMGFRCCAEIL